MLEHFKGRKKAGLGAVVGCKKKKKEKKKQLVHYLFINIKYNAFQSLSTSH